MLIHFPPSDILLLNVTISPLTLSIPYLPTQKRFRAELCKILDLINFKESGGRNSQFLQGFISRNSAPREMANSLSFTYVGKSCPSSKFVAKIKLSRKFPKLQ